MDPRDVPDDVYSTLVEAATANRQSLSAYLVDRLTEAAQVARPARPARRSAADLRTIGRRPVKLTGAEIIEDVRGEW